MSNLPWSERVPMLSINPDAASRDDVARLAAELMEANQKVNGQHTRFHIIDKQTGRPPDTEEIALHEPWAKSLTYCDIEDFAVMGDGTLVLLDETGCWVSCPANRFEIVYEEEP